MNYNNSGTIYHKTHTISSGVANPALSSYSHRYNYDGNKAHQITSVGPVFPGSTGGGVNDRLEYNNEGSVKKMYKEVTTPGDTTQLRKFVWNENQQLMGVRNPNGIHHYLYDANGQRLMKGSLRRNGAILNGGDGGEAQNSYIADPYTVYVNPYYIITHSRRDLAQASRRRSGAIARPSPADKRDVANWIEADNDLSDIEASPQPIGAKTNLLSLLNIVGAQENVDYNEIALYGEEPQTYAQAVMSFEDYDLIIGEELEEDPGNPPEPAGNQDRCTFSRYWPFVNHELDCDPVIYFYHSDYLGHTEFITDRNGEAYQYFHYSAFGEALIEEHSGQGTHTDYFRFNGKELDPETGNYYYGARYYDPKVSVWLSVDPLATKDHNLPLTPYHFSANNPITIIDPDGRDWFVNKETGSTAFRPNLGKDDAGQLGENFSWVAGNDDINLDIKDWSSGDLITDQSGNGEFNYVGHDFDQASSENIMEKNGYEMVPLKATHTHTTRVNRLLSKNKNAPEKITNITITEKWHEVSYVPNSYSQNINQSIVESTDSKHGPLYTRSTITSNRTYSYKKHNPIVRFLGKLNFLGAKSYNILNNVYEHDKNIIKP